MSDLVIPRTRPPVTSVFGRTGAVAAASGDYNGDQIAEDLAVTNYTPTAETVEGYLEGIDDALGTIGSAYSDDDVIALVDDGYRLRWAVETDSVGTHLIPDVVMLDEAESYASEITIDLARDRGDRHTFTLTGNPTLLIRNYGLGTSPERVGKLFRLVPTQDATGGRSIDFAGSSQTWFFPDGEPKLSAIPGSQDELEFLVTSLSPPTFTFVRAIHRPRRLDLSGSSSGGTWTSRTSAADNYWNSVAYGNGLFVAVSQTGTGNRVMTSPNGLTWTIRTSAADNDWEAVTYGNGLFVAVSSTGTGNRVMTSPDGINWTSRTSAADNDWQSVTYGGGLFVAVSTSGTGNRVMTSPNGITWTSRTSAADNNWIGVTYGNGLFVAVSTSGTGNRVMTSPDGINWTSRTSAADNGWQSVAYGNGLFVAVAASGTGNRVMTSPDGITWTIRVSAANETWESVTYGNGLFVAVAVSGTGNRVMTSPDGISWTIGASAADNLWRSVAFGGGLFVAVAASGTGNRVMTSPIGFAVLDWLRELNYVTLASGSGDYVIELGDVLPSQTIRLAVDNSAGATGTLSISGVDFGDAGDPTLPASGKYDLFELTAIDSASISGRTIQTGLTP